MADEELTEQEKMDRMVAELSADIEDINQDGKESEQETEKTAETEVEAKGEEPGEPEPEEKDLKKTISGEPALEEETDEDKTEDPAMGPDLYQEESNADEKSEEDTDALDEYEYPDMEEDDHGGNRRRNAVVWSIIAILLLGSASVWFVYYKDVNILEHPMVSRWAQKLKLTPASEDANDLEPPLPKSPAAELHVKTPQTSVSSLQTEAKPGPLTKSEMFEQKMQQILAVRDKLSEKRALAASIRERLNEQILALELEISAKQRTMEITSYTEAVKSPRIYYNIRLIQQLKAYTSKLAERIRYYEDGYDKMRFRYQEADDNFKIIELWSDKKTKRLMTKIDKAINEYQAENKPHMFTNKQIVLDTPRKVWSEIPQSKIQNQL